MKKWCVIDDATEKNMLCEMYAYDTIEKALEEGQKRWDHMTEHDRNARDHFMVGLCNVEPGFHGTWDFVEDDNGNVDTDIYEIAKEWK